MKSQREKGHSEGPNIIYNPRIKYYTYVLSTNDKLSREKTNTFFFFLRGLSKDVEKFFDVIIEKGCPSLKNLFIYHRLIHPYNRTSRYVNSGQRSDSLKKLLDLNSS